MSLSVYPGFFSSLASLRPRDGRARSGHIVDLDRSVERGPHPCYVSPDTLLGGTGVTSAGATA